ncbi:hypothetical protein ATK30_6864 [Amycolatopsis echigonensis]|uniref:Uncharacterized protein n=1 Tax=Amycolatopsis echigonensis TaxID=2576905 RepID=A0A2N3WPX0_9PSEU|nr:hypothetical protein [Amycolatopsis niigatensis]PKV95931.1 hypothetical protein ATK30_6864 [Amycolatopsis niigatensis]
MASIVIDGVTQPGNTGEGVYPKFILDSRTGFFTIQLAAPTGTPGTYSGGMTAQSFVEGDDAHLYQYRLLVNQYTPPATLPPA